jgi:hypothetical protein
VRIEKNWALCQVEIGANTKEAPVTIRLLLQPEIESLFDEDEFGVRAVDTSARLERARTQ